MQLPRRPFTQIDNEILERVHEVGAGPVLVLIQLLRYRNRQTGQCNPSYARLSRDTTFHRDTVMKYTKILEDAGWLTKRASWAQEGDRSSNWYDFPDWILGDRTEQPGGRLIRLPMGKNAESNDHPGRRNRPKPEVNNQIEITKKDVSMVNEEKTDTGEVVQDDTVTPLPSEPVCTNRCQIRHFGDNHVCVTCWKHLTFVPSEDQNDSGSDDDTHPIAEVN